MFSVAFRPASAADLYPTLMRALAHEGPSVVDVPIDYRENLRLTGTHLGLRTSKASLLCIGAEACEALRDILQIGAVCLRGPEADTLLLLGSGKGLIVILLVEGRDGLRLSEALLSL